jgi:hypothetical protein
MMETMKVFHVIKYEAALYGEVKKPGLGPLHTEFDAMEMLILHSLSLQKL